MAIRLFDNFIQQPWVTSAEILFQMGKDITYLSGLPRKRDVPSQGAILQIHFKYLERFRFLYLVTLF